MRESSGGLSEKDGYGLIRQFTEALRYMPDSQRTWDEMLGIMMDVTRGENCSLMLKSNHGDGLVVRAAKGRKDRELPVKESPFRKYFHLNGGVATWVLKTGHGVYLSDAEKDSRFVQIEESPFRIGSLMCFPVRDGNRTVGIVNLSHEDRSAFGEIEERAMKIVANQLAIVLATTPGDCGSADEVSGAPGPSDREPWALPGKKGRQVVIPWAGGYRKGEGICFLYQNEKMVRIVKMIEQVADTDVTVLIHGESGVGKEPIARALHYRSTRKNKPFIKVNCAALPEELLESELFGYERGAFTGAYNRKPGKFELAQGGTIFLDEIAEISPSLQAKLLQVLQDGEFARLGGKRDIQVSVRVLAATNKNLEEYVRAGRFREDLYYRLNVLNIHVPPLRERREEIPLLVQYFLDMYNRKYGKTGLTLSRETRDLLLLHEWPGNVRELENMIKRLVVLGDEGAIKKELGGRPLALQSLQARPERAAPPEPEPVSLKEISRRAALEAEREVIEKTLKKTRWNRKMAARLLNISYKALLYKIKECGLDSSPTMGG
ncbi:MAG: sigma 54-interacting transcriptional regulator [Deltaproteobacteria bacterium]|nr:sigma 54-interacting transcriptional regulator [Deltaproteobacteria bacterium]